LLNFAHITPLNRERGSESLRERAFEYICRIEEFCLSFQTFPYRGESADQYRPGRRTVGFDRRVKIAFEVNV